MNQSTYPRTFVEKCGATLEQVFRYKWLAQILAGLGGIVYYLQLVYFLRTQASGLDEGMYLYEGYLFSVGHYIPYQDFGIRMYQLPMAYLIPGYIQRWFGPGLRVGRIFAAIVACLLLLALWIAARRLAGAWLASGAVWIFALDPALIKLYSQADSQGLAACILMWSMAFTLGEKRQAWQIAAGSFLAGILILTRVNLLPVLPFLVLYILWQNGWKLAILSAASALFPLIGMHILYWPNILRIWAYWLPEQIAPSLNPWRPPSPEIISKIPGYLPRIQSFTNGLRFFFVTATGIVAAWIAWPRRANWKNQGHYRVAVFLSALFIVLALMHIWATVLINNCIFCLPGYFAFFIGLGVLLLVVSLRSWQTILPPFRQRLGYVAILGLMAAWGYSIHLLDFFNKAFSVNLAKYLLYIKAPLVRGHHEIYIYIANGLDVSYDLIFRTLGGLISCLMGILLGCLLILIIWRASRLLSSMRFLKPYSTEMRVFIIFLILGGILSPTNLFAGNYTGYDCGDDVISSLEAVGAHLKKYIPANALIYWDGPDSPAALLYIPQSRIFPQQLTGAYEWREGGDPVVLARYGLWDQAMAESYFEQSDYVIAWQSYLASWEKIQLKNPDKYEKLPSSPPIYNCYPDQKTQLLIYKKK
jgi:hypothetical protein